MDLNKKQIKLLFEYSLEEPEKWRYNEDKRSLKYTFSNHNFTYDGFQLNFNTKFILNKMPWTFWPFHKVTWRKEGGAAALFASAIVFVISYWALFAIISLIAWLSPYLQMGFVNLLTYTCITYLIICVLYGGIFYLRNFKIVKKFSTLNKILKEKERKIKQRKKEEKLKNQNEEFDLLVSKHFIRQNRKKKLENLND